MSVTRDELNALTERVEVLEVWAGPGQAEALAETIRGTRGDVRKIAVQTAKIATLAVKVTTLDVSLVALGARVDGLDAKIDKLSTGVDKILNHLGIE